MTRITHLCPFSALVAAPPAFSDAPVAAATLAPMATYGKAGAHPGIGHGKTGGAPAMRDAHGRH